MKKLTAIALILLGIGVLCAFFVFDRDEVGSKFKGEPYSQEKIVDSSAIRSIQTETDTFDITYVRGTSKDIKIKLDGDVSKKQLDKIVFKAETKGDTLYIVGDTKDHFSIGITIIDLKMTVELPEKLWDSVSIDTDTGNIVIDQLEADKMNLKSDTGNLKISNYVTKEFAFKTDTGNVTLTDGRGTLKGETDTGNVRVETDELRNNIAVKTDTGNIAINLDKDPASASINIQMDTGNSRIEWDGYSVNKETDRHEEGMIGSGEFKIDLESDTGDFKLGNR